MSIKPFSQEVKSDVKTVSEIKPFVERAVGGEEIKVETVPTENRRAEEEQVFSLIRFFGSFNGFISASVFFLFIVLVVDSVEIFSEFSQASAPMSILYLLGVTVLLTSLTLLSLQSIRQIRLLKSVTKIQKFYKAQSINPSKELVPKTLKLLDGYKKLDDEVLSQRADILVERISSTHAYSELYEELDKEVLLVLDTKAGKKIKEASLQAALSTAISPLALLDAGIIIWRSVRLSEEIAQVYGYKPGYIATAILLKRAAFNVFFASGTELAVEYINEAGESTLLSKVSLSASQGLTNGVLMARLGYGLMQACRPLPYTSKRESFMKSMLSALKEKLNRV